VDGEVLSPAETEDFFSACLRGEPTPAQVAAALTAIRMRGETVEEIAAAARAMRGAARRLEHPFEVMDVCGTGGDGLHTLNISSAVAFVLAGMGVRIAKHGNRAITSRSGTADVLAHLGVNLDPGDDLQLKALEQANICFLFAQARHGAMRHVSPIRQELGFRTLFNVLGPLTNPAGATRQVLGVASAAQVRPIAEALRLLGVTKAWVVHGQGMDELTTTGSSVVTQVSGQSLQDLNVDPDDLGLPRAKLSDLVGGDPEFNAKAMTRLLQGEPGAYRDIVCLNAAAGFVVADRAETLAAGLELAAESLDSGKALGALTCLVEITR
jgi:anthranilate phosphoribosyltransferase